MRMPEVNIICNHVDVDRMETTYTVDSVRLTLFGETPQQWTIALIITEESLKSIIGIIGAAKRRAPAKTFQATADLADLPELPPDLPDVPDLPPIPPR